MEAKPASSVHLQWDIPAVKCNEIEFYNEVTVQRTAECSYFCAIQFWPGGYCGIQEREKCQDKIAIFSVWDREDGEHTHKVEEVSKGDEVTVCPFGGEGEGLKSIRSLDWHVGEKVGFKVISKLENSSWFMSCFVNFRGNEYHMATFKRKGSNPMQVFVSFVEDYNRCNNACGMNYNRSSVFSGTSCKVNGVTHQLTSPTFTKVENGSDRHGVNLCFGKNCPSGFELSTGGSSNDCCMPNATRLSGACKQ